MDYKQMEQAAVLESKESEVLSVPYIVHEGVMARNERTIKRLLIALVITILLLFASNAMWLHYISDCDIQTFEYTQDGEGVNLVGDGNGVSYNEPESQNPGNTEKGQDAG